VAIEDRIETSEVVFERLSELPPYMSKVAARWDGYDSDSKYLFGHADELYEQFPEEWLAVFEGKVVGHDRRHSALRRALRKLKLHDSGAVIWRLTHEPIDTSHAAKFG